MTNDNNIICRNNFIFTKDRVSYADTTQCSQLVTARLAGADLSIENGGNKSCLTTYIFNPVDTCTGTPSPEKLPPLLKTPDSGPKQVLSEDVLPSDKHMHSNFVYDKILPNGRPNLLKDYELNYQNCNFGIGDHSKCCVGGHFGR